MAKRLSRRSRSVLDRRNVSLDGFSDEQLRSWAERAEADGDHELADALAESVEEYQRTDWLGIAVVTVGGIVVTAGLIVVLAAFTESESLRDAIVMALLGIALLTLPGAFLFKLGIDRLWRKSGQEGGLHWGRLLLYMLAWAAATTAVLTVPILVFGEGFLDWLPGFMWLAVPSALLFAPLAAPRTRDWLGED